MTLLLENKKYKELKTWFNYHDIGNTRKIDHKDTGVEEDFIDKVILWGKFFMPEYIVDSTPDFHRDLIAYYFSRNNEYIAAPRGFSKTTIIQLCTAFSIIHKIDIFIVIIEKSFTEASEVIKGVRDILVVSKRIKAIYGDLQVQEDDGQKDPDAKGDVSLNGVRLRAKGFNTTIRGLKSGASRPTRIILDDVEDDEHINNPEQREKYLNNYNRGIQPALDISGSVKVFGTILHYDSLLMNLIKWHRGKIYQAFDPANPENTLLWKERWTYEKLMQKKEQMTTEKGSSAFTQEYLNNPTSEEDRTFKENWLYREDRKIKFKEIEHKLFNGYAAIDVADSTKDGSDWTGVIVHLIDSNGNRYRVYVKRERRNILGKVDLIFELWNKWHQYGLNEIGVEKKAFEDEIKPLLDIEMERRQVYPIVTELKPAHTSKRSRIKGNLEGLYEKGKIWTIIDDNGLTIGDTDKLLNELYDFPSSAKDDLSDAEAYITDMAQIPTEHVERQAVAPNDDPFGESLKFSFDEVFE